MTQFDVIVIGGGMVGAAVAVGLAKQKKRVAIVEAHTPQPFSPEQAIDLRVSAISLTSIQLLQDLGAWSAIESKRALLYLGLETWEMTQCITQFHADDLGIEHLGFMVENRLVQLGLWEQFGHYGNLEVITPDHLKHIEFNANENKVTLVSGRQLSARYVIGADGAHSKVREQAHIGITAWDYRQHCMLINIQMLDDDAPQDTTWQCFTANGPRAFLPMPAQVTTEGTFYQGSLVWYDSPQRIKQLSQLNNEALAQEVRLHFPDRLGAFKVLNKGSFPLTRRHAHDYIANRCILIGDSAHTINPLAGQGVNIGFKDVQALLEVIADKGLDDPAQLQAYQALRKKDNLLMQTGMDVFYKTFSNEIAPLKLLRNGALKAANHSGVLKKQVLKYALGL